MAKKSGIICMLLGALLILSSAALALFNMLDSNRAADSAEKIMPKLRQEISENNDKNDKSFLLDGNKYIGYLTIPDLELELPVMSDWDYTRLRYAPCRFCGSAETDDLVIAAHNYPSHFGRLQELRLGDTVKFTDISGSVYTYSVGDIETLASDKVNEMIHSSWDLSLYTCNYSGKSRVTVRCQRISD